MVLAVGNTDAFEKDDVISALAQSTNPQVLDFARKMIADNASTVALHGLTLAPMARWLGLALGGRGGLLIVGASAWSVGLGDALRNAGMPVIIVDRSSDALNAARRLGLQTLRMAIDARRGDHRFAGIRIPARGHSRRGL